MSEAQHRISEFLDAELEHSLGAYRVAVSSLNGLLSRVQQRDGTEPATGPPSRLPMASFLHDALSHATDLNGDLDDKRHLASEDFRHPRLRKTPIFTPTPGLGDDRPGDRSDELRFVADFFETACRALDPALIDSRPEKGQQPETEEEALALLGERIMMSRFGASFDLSGQATPDERAKHRSEEEARMRRRLIRYERRRTDVFTWLEPTGRPGFALDLVRGHLRGEKPIGGFVVEVLVEAHLRMHIAEHGLSSSLAKHLSLDAAELADIDRHVDQAIQLLTFVYSISRTCPWLFAEGPQEAKRVLVAPKRAWDRLVPTVTMWTSAQLMMLALHRRAYAYSIRADHQVQGDYTREAFNDYHKLQRDIRDIARRLRLGPISVRGSAEFLSSLDALADHHIGELYRSSNAYTVAMEYFERADARLDRLRLGAPSGSQQSLDRTLRNSRWRVELLIGTGKACYELGRMKESLCWHLRAWRALLELVAQDTDTVANTEPLDTAISWLLDVAHEPIVHRDDLRTYLHDVVAQLAGIAIDPRLGTLAADVLTRVGHVLFVLRPEQESRQPTTDNKIDELLAVTCLLKAAECDRTNTLLGADMLKVLHRVVADESNLAKDSDGVRELRERIGAMAALADQWSGGGDDFERLTRATEYVLLSELINLTEKPAKSRAPQPVSRPLLAGVFTHTDSINLRRSQVHSAMMRQPRRNVRLPSEIARPTIELVCMRRFSSAFPLLPRPAHFRALAGGYFVRLHADDRDPFGIVIDPGSDFIENLYRANFALSDIDMIVVTHDHVDHIASLEPLLSVLYEQAEVKSEEQKPLPLLANRSVLSRQMPISRYRKLLLFELSETAIAWEPHEADWWTAREKAGLPVPAPITELNERLSAQLGTAVTFTAVSSASASAEEWGHNDLCDHPSLGFRIDVGTGQGPSIAFTSDLPRPTLHNWERALDPLLSADVLVAHLSALPLVELRQAAGLANVPASKGPLARDQTTLLALHDQTRTKDDGIAAARLRYAHWLSYRRDGEKLAAPLVGSDQLADWQIPAGQHLYLEGLVAVATAYRQARERSDDPAGTFVIGELSEELGSLRGKVAHWVNVSVFDAADRWKALTADIGLTIAVGGPDAHQTRTRCSSCALDNDLAEEECWHQPAGIEEVCVKGENEGMFYNCRQHDPLGDAPNAFVERMERWDVFGR